MKQLITQSAVQIGLARWNPIDDKSGMILAANLAIHAPVELLKVRSGRVADCIQGNIGDIRKAAADTWIGGTYPGEVLRPERCGQRRTEIQALSGNGPAVYAFSESVGVAGCGADHGAVDGRSRKAEKCGSNAARGRKSVKLGGWIPLGAGCPDSLRLLLVREEREYLVLPDWPPDAATPLVVSILIAEKTTFRRSLL